MKMKSNRMPSLRLYMDSTYRIVSHLFFLQLLFMHLNKRNLPVSFLQIINNSIGKYTLSETSSKTDIHSEIRG